jgi:ATP-dependent Clp protease protease subunit
MFDRRLVYLRGRLDDERGARVAAELMALDALGDDPITMLIDSAEGTIDAALAVSDTIDLLGVPVEATCIGRAEGPAVVVLAVADVRRASPNARFRLSAPWLAPVSLTRDVEAWAEQQRERLDRFVVRLAQAAGQRIEQVREDVLAGRSFDAEAAIVYGIVDEVTGSRVERRQG